MSNENLYADISSNNPSFHAAAYRSAGHRVIMVKATEGLRFVNPKYSQWVQDAHNHHLAVFHYCFARPEKGEPKAQMDHFWNTVRPHFRRPPERPHTPGDVLVIDVETGSPQEAAQWLTEAEAHLSAISDVEEIVCYTFLSFFEVGDIKMRSKRIHLAAWGDTLPTQQHHDRWEPLSNGQNLFAWQFSDGVVGGPPHRFAGIPGVCDGSVLNPVVANAIKNVTK